MAVLSAGFHFRCSSATMRKADFIAWSSLALVMALVSIVFWRQSGAIRVASLPVISNVAAFQLTNQFGSRVTREDLAGYVWVVDVIFTRCPGQCHRLSQQMRQMQKLIPAGAPVRFVSLTADPEFDSEAILRRYGDRYSADGASWMFLTGTRTEIYRLAMESLKFSVVETDPKRAVSLEDLFIHSASFALVDRQGRLRSMVQSEDSDSTKRLLEQIKVLCGEKWK